MRRIRPFTATKVVGVTFNNAQENIKRLARKDIPLELVREPNNPYDPNAIKVMVAEWFLGYIRKELASKLAPEIDAGKQYEASFVCINRSPYHDLVGLTIRITEIGDWEDAYNRILR